MPSLCLSGLGADQRQRHGEVLAGFAHLAQGPAEPAELRPRGGARAAFGLNVDLLVAFGVRNSPFGKSKRCAEAGVGWKIREFADQPSSSRTLPAFKVDVRD